MKTKNILYILPLAALIGCEPEFDEITQSGTAGEADFSNMVAVGNSLTAGFQSNALRRDKQENSFPAILAEQMKLAGGGEFSQPLLAPGVGVGGSGNAEFNLVIQNDCLGNPGPSPQPIAAQGQVDQFDPSNFIGIAESYNNVGVPGAKSFHLLAPGYGNPAGIATGAANPFYARFVNPADVNETVITAAAKQAPTFFTLFIGNNDVLSYSTSGGSGNATTGADPSMYGPNDITNPQVFAGTYQGLLGALTANGAKGAVANIPDVTSIPYFTTVKWNALVLTQEQADALNMAFAPYNAALDNPQIRAQFAFAGVDADREATIRKLNFQAGANGFIRFDNELASAQTGAGANDTLPKYRQLGAGELVTLVVPSDDLKCQGFGSANAATGMPNPLTENFVLDSAEIAAVRTATAAYNATIEQLATANDLAFVDAAAKLEELATTGININGKLYTSTFGTGGAFSLDGVHPSTRGYAIIANEFIKAINAKYGASIPQTDVNSFPALE